MAFGEAIAAGFANYAVFSGRASRPEFWWWQLFVLLASVVAAVVDVAVTGPDGFGVVGTLFGLATLLPSLAVTVRRLHDNDLSGWWVLIVLVPILGAIAILVLMLRRGTPGANRFGAAPA